MNESILKHAANRGILIMSKLAPYLLVPTGLWMMWTVAYINHVIGSQFDDWRELSFFMTLAIIEIIAIAISVLSFIKIVNRRKQR